MAPEVAGMSFEQALAELEKIVQDLERGQLDLDAAIQAYERGTALKLHCEGKLQRGAAAGRADHARPGRPARAEPTDLA